MATNKIGVPASQMSGIKTGPKVSSLADLRNIGKAALADFCVVGICAVEDLIQADAENLYRRLNTLTEVRHDPCVEDVFAAAIHQARIGEALDWWKFTAARKERDRLRRSAAGS